MYNLPEYKEKDLAKIRSFMQANPFVLLCCVSAEGKPVATHVPVLIKQHEGKDYLLGHVMKNTDHHRALENNKDVLVVFSGPHSYVSASWYDNKQVGSTWNYMAVHAHGKVNFVDTDALKEILRETTAHFENNPDSPSLFEHLPADYIDKLTKAIIGFRIDISELQHIFKLSQDRDEKSYDNIIDHLHTGDQHQQQIAEEMKVRFREKHL
jgi:transcriptional regulator